MIRAAPKITLGQLRLLLAAVETGSVGAAARRFGLTQSGASQALSALEKTLDVELLVRTRGGVTATALAETLLADAADAVAAVDRIAARARAAAGRQERPLRIAAIPSIAERTLSAWCRRLRQLAPTLVTGAFEGGHGEVGAWVARGLADIAVTSVVPEGLPSVALRPEALLVVGRRDDPDLQAASVPVALLAGRALVLAGGCEPVVEPLLGGGAVPRPGDITTAGLTTALEMVRQGQGVTLFAATSFPRDDVDGLTVRPLDPPVTRRLHLVFRAETVESGVVDLLLRVLEEEGWTAEGHKPG
ncbi:LysR family transcriptional regulator [Tistrella mobilis]|jgi:DNA-binding transcriptional LysR family regulator|uniref:LysR family transcriptional regulator n=1 Tax=Tistrella mobilis TaxID=171437 RepID=UPI003557B18F